MPRVNDWHASVKAAPLHDDDPPANHWTDDGDYYTVITESAGPSPATIERAHVPVSKAWTCDTELVTVAPRHVETRRKTGGQLRHFAGRTGGEDPSGQSWEVCLDIAAYPVTEYHRAQLRVSETVEYVPLSPETLVTVATEK